MIDRIKIQRSKESDPIGERTKRNSQSDVRLFQSGKLSVAVGVPAGFSSGAANLPGVAGGQGETIPPPRCLGRC